MEGVLVAINRKRDLCTTSLNGHHELFGVPHPGKANGPPWWANCKLFEAVRPSFERYGCA
jgi:hypothetical protein